MAAVWPLGGQRFTRSEIGDRTLLAKQQRFVGARFNDPTMASVDVPQGVQPQPVRCGCDWEAVGGKARR